MKTPLHRRPVFIVRFAAILAAGMALLIVTWHVATGGRQTDPGVPKETAKHPHATDNGLARERTVAAAPTITFSIPPPTAEENLLEQWVLRSTALRNFLERNPDLKIPEIQLLRAEDWILVAKDNPMKTDEELRKAARDLRRMGKEKFGPQIVAAVQATLMGGTGIPNDLTQLQPHFQFPVDRSFLERYQINMNATDAKGRPRLEIVESRSVEDNDSRLFVWKNGFSIKSTTPLRTAVEDAQIAFAKSA